MMAIMALHRVMWREKGTTNSHQLCSLWWSKLMVASWVKATWLILTQKDYGQPRLKMPQNPECLTRAWISQVAQFTMSILSQRNWILERPQRKQVSPISQFKKSARSNWSQTPYLDLRKSNCQLSGIGTGNCFLKGSRFRMWTWINHTGGTLIE